MFPTSDLKLPSNTRASSSACARATKSQRRSRGHESPLDRPSSKPITTSTITWSISPRHHPYAEINAAKGCGMRSRQVRPHEASRRCASRCYVKNKTIRRINGTLSNTNNLNAKHYISFDQRARRTVACIGHTVSKLALRGPPTQ